MTKIESTLSNVPCAKVREQIFAPVTYLFYFSLNSEAPRPFCIIIWRLKLQRAFLLKVTRPIRELNHYPNLDDGYISHPKMEPIDGMNNYPWIR